MGKKKTITLEELEKLASESVTLPSAVNSDNPGCPVIGNDFEGTALVFEGSHDAVLVTAPDSSLGSCVHVELAEDPAVPGEKLLEHIRKRLDDESEDDWGEYEGCAA